MTSFLTEVLVDTLWISQVFPPFAGISGARSAKNKCLEYEPQTDVIGSLRTFLVMPWLAGKLTIHTRCHRMRRIFHQKGPLF